MRELQRALLDWADGHGRRLAFRATTDAYKALVAETMAQQTQVSRVEPAVAGFLARFPTVQSLAAAPVADVLRAWRGLGYNRRALNLQRAAQAVMEHHGGEFPRDLRALTALPGVGPYTARAIVVHAFGAREAAVDANIRRVLGRVRGGEPTVRELQAFAEALVPGDDPAAWTNALMDLGATVCRPARAACDDCPIRQVVRLGARRRVRAWPTPKHAPGRIRRSHVRADDALAPRTDHRPRAGCAGRRVGHVRRATRKPSPP